MLTKKELITNYNIVRITGNRPVLSPDEQKVIEDFIEYLSAKDLVDNITFVQVPAPHKNKGVLSEATEEKLSNYFQKRNKENIIELDITKEGL